MVILGLGLALAGCTNATGPVEPATASVEVRLPVGLELFVDGTSLGTTPLQALGLSNGPRNLRLLTPCGTHEATFEVGSGAQTISSETFNELRVFTLRITAKDLEDKPLSPTVRFGDIRVPDPSDPVLLAACPARLKIEAAGLGAFWEELEPNPSKAIQRDVVLRPGSDVVRVHGGPFRLGPPGPDRYEPHFDWEGLDPDEVKGWPDIQRFDIQVETFEVDRTLVTAAQLAACRETGGCPRDPRYMTVGNPEDDAREHCTTELHERTVVEGREDHPANCVAVLEAEDYCQSRGMRLLTEAEYEFMARSRKPDNMCPWGGTFDDATIDRSCLRAEQLEQWAKRKTPTVPVCAFSDATSQQGVCDISLAIGEYVEMLDLPDRTLRPGSVRHKIDKEPFRYGLKGRGFAAVATFDRALFIPQWQRRVDESFRCARTLGKTR